MVLIFALSIIRIGNSIPIELLPIHRKEDNSIIIRKIIITSIQLFYYYYFYKYNKYIDIKVLLEYLFLVIKLSHTLTYRKKLLSDLQV